MKEGPNIALIGSLIGDPCRSNMLAALMSGKALTATELAAQGNVTPQTASGHLSKLEKAHLLRRRKQGRHNYFELAEGVGSVLENVMGLAASAGHIRTRTGPKDEALRKARVCYDHLAGDLGVLVFDSLIRKGFLEESNDQLHLTGSGTLFVRDLGVQLPASSKSRRPTCLACLDWSARRSHLAGVLGAELLTFFEQDGWVTREEKPSRVITITSKGERRFQTIFGEKQHRRTH